MRELVKSQTGYLHLQRLTTTLGLARRLPPEVAFRYHALPVAEHAGRITVAMANPDDDAACEAISMALGTVPFMVESTPEAIDSLLAEIWPERAPAPLHLLACNGLVNSDESGEPAGQVWDFALALSDLLEAQLSYSSPGTLTGTREGPFRGLAAEVARIGCDLVVVPATAHSPLRRMALGSIEHRLVESVPASLLVVRKPRWPLKKVLLVVRCEETDEAAAGWAIRLGRTSGAHVTIQAVMPPLPVLYQVGLEDLLKPNTASGDQLRQLARQMEQWGMASTLCLRQGEPDWQIREETIEGDHDLIVIAAEQTNRLQRLLSGELVRPLLSWMDRPVLIAK